MNHSERSAGEATEISDNDGRLRLVRRASWVVLLCALGCGGTTTEHDGEATLREPLSVGRDEAATRAWQPALPTGVTQVTAGEGVVVDHCLYTIGTATFAPPFPPQTLVWLSAEALRRGPCGSVGYLVLGTSYGPTAASLARAPSSPAVVATFTGRATPGGSAHSHLSIVQPDLVTGNVVHAAVLAAASPDLQHSHLGNVQVGTPWLTSAGDLFVSGTFDGTLPGAVGSGNDYVAIYPSFLTDPHHSPTPATIIVQ